MIRLSKNYVTAKKAKGCNFTSEDLHDKSRSKNKAKTAEK